MLESSCVIRSATTSCIPIRPNSSFTPRPASLTGTDSTVPAACASLLSLKTAGSMSYHTVGSSRIGHLPSLAASVTLEDSSIITNERRRGLGRRESCHVPFPFPSFSTVAPSMAAKEPNKPARSHTSKNPDIIDPAKSSRNFWNTVMADTLGNATESCSSSEDSGLYRVQTTPPPNLGTAYTDGRLVCPTVYGALPPMTVPCPYPLSATKRKAPPCSASDESVQCHDSIDHADPECQMNIPCLLCGVRFRKPGHLNMHWRSVHAPPVNASYPGNYASDTAHRRGADMREMIAQSDRQERPVPHEQPSVTIRLPVAEFNRRIARSNHAYGCPQCDARFRRGSDRNRHMRMVHERRRPFACERCPKQFGRKSFLQAHVLTVHEKRRPFACEDCGAAFGQRSSLTRHAKKIHEFEP
jgi:uncharacterized C2H2 Zn-finger protein